MSTKQNLRLNSRRLFPNPIDFYNASAYLVVGNDLKEEVVAKEFVEKEEMEKEEVEEAVAEIRVYSRVI